MCSWKVRDAGDARGLVDRPDPVGQDAVDQRGVRALDHQHLEAVRQRPLDDLPREADLLRGAGTGQTTASRRRPRQTKRRCLMSASPWNGLTRSYRCRGPFVGQRRPRIAQAHAAQASMLEACHSRSSRFMPTSSAASRNWVFSARRRSRTRRSRPPPPARTCWPAR